jgi:hypothetical protein
MTSGVHGGAGRRGMATWEIAIRYSLSGAEPVTEQATDLDRHDREIAGGLVRGSPAYGT